MSSNAVRSGERESEGSLGILEPFDCKESIRLSEEATVSGTLGNVCD